MMFIEYFVLQTIILHGYFAKLLTITQFESPASLPSSQKQPRNHCKSQKIDSGPSSQGSSKLRGLLKDTPEVRMSKTLSWLLRHGTQGEVLQMRVREGQRSGRLKSQGVDLRMLQGIVAADAKQRHDLISEKNEAGAVKLQLTPILSVPGIPSARQGLSKTKRNYIHLATKFDRIDRMRKSATCFTYIDVTLALSEGINFLSDNDVVLNEGNE
ncbi:trna phosphotransferase 1 [Moniliophthora roreri MCA 2997]|uniref:Trna phosphotransferase 1 n=1 Tax=Moniliophthora roreri (strain MCA 2997) TaxID=1381753 RepID=V2XEJ4_MONRO|nr:trna phosphotransferase 1 [Moniliophthora roreri MCA 2997]